MAAFKRQINSFCAFFWNLLCLVKNTKCLWESCNYLHWIAVAFCVQQTDETRSKSFKGSPEPNALYNEGNSAIRWWRHCWGHPQVRWRHSYENLHKNVYLSGTVTDSWTNSDTINILLKLSFETIGTGSPHLRSVKKFRGRENLAVWDWAFLGDVHTSEVT